MRLCSMTIQGFKSFPDKITLQFDGEITAIVGPNGSGKSNISDAIRWVMGEQNSRTLRGAKMEDVIFGGTQKRPQLGFAEASLVFDNSDRYFPIETDEVMVTRRYFRSGDSEFYINKQSVRLRDVVELFMDTGLGREGYSNISQGRIDEILSRKSTDRREIFEEAAGISKYRHRKEETERRLIHTEENLLRINDKISELELQVEPLREQADKAKKYLALRDELKGLEIALWLDSLSRLDAAAKKAEADYSSAAFILEQEHENLNALYQKNDQLTASLVEKDADIEKRRAAISAEEAEQQRLNSRKAVLEGEKKNIEENIARLYQELSDQDTRSGGILTQIRARKDRIEAIDKESKELREKLEKVQSRLDELTESSEGMNRSYLELRNEIAAAAAELAGKRSDLTALNESADRNGERRKELEADKTSGEQQKTEAEGQLSDCRNSLKKARQEVDTEKNVISGYELRRKARADKAEELDRQVRASQASIDASANRLKIFREMEREYEGFPKAVRFVMQQAESGTLQQIHGPVSRLIKTDDAYSVAVEIALGAAMQHIVVTSEADGKAAIVQLKNRDMGRATFLPLSVIEGRTLTERGLEDFPGFVGLGSSLVRCEDRYRAVVENLLGRTVIVRTLDDAIAMARRYHNRFKIVTLDGQVVNPGGSMTGGSVSKNTGILSRANEIERLTAELRTLHDQFEDQKKQHAEACRQRDLAEFELMTASGKLREQEDEVLRLEGEEKKYSVLCEAIRQAAASNERELETLIRRIDTDQLRRNALDEECAKLEKKQSELQTKVDSLTVDQTELSKEGSSLSDDLTAYKMQQAALSAEKLTAMENLRQLEGLSTDMEGDRSQKLELIGDQERRLKEQETSAKENDEQIAAQTRKTDGLKAELQEALTSRSAVEAERTANDKNAQKKNKDIIDMEREAARLEAKKNTAQMEEKQIVDKLWDNYELTPSSAPAQAAKLESAAAATRRTTELHKKIRALGTPNLGAIDEFARVSERYEYLTGQRNDVLQSKKELEGIIRDITKSMTEIFTGEFARINRYFGETFTEMFGGGRASLELEDPNEPLTTGIEIRVQPPGKQLKTILLLSGGEKAFVAIALYFAILKVRPTPFCMLDEIDAALDDTNVERFSNYLRQLCRKTQFIVITHRRGTMEEADALFGVTMQEQGVSKILHLDLDQMERELGISE